MCFSLSKDLCGNWKGARRKLAFFVLSKPSAVARIAHHSGIAILSNLNSCNGLYRILKLFWAIVTKIILKLIYYLLLLLVCLATLNQQWIKRATPRFTSVYSIFFYILPFLFFNNRLFIPEHLSGGHLSGTKAS